MKTVENTLISTIRRYFEKAPCNLTGAELKDTVEIIRIENPESIVVQFWNSHQHTVGTPVLYIPRHAKGDVTHCDVERGLVSDANFQYSFINFGNGPRAVLPSQLVGEV